MEEPDVRPQHGLLKGEIGQPYNLTALGCRFVRANANTGPVGTGDGVGPRVAVINQGTDEFVDKVWM